MNRHLTKKGDGNGFLQTPSLLDLSPEEFQMNVFHFLRIEPTARLHRAEGTNHNLQLACTDRNPQKARLARGHSSLVEPLIG